MEIEFTDGPTITLDDAMPGSYVEKTFKVENVGTVSTNYDIYMSDLINTFADKTDLVYTLTSNDGGANVSQTQVPDTNTKIVSAKETNKVIYTDVFGKRRLVSNNHLVVYKNNKTIDSETDKIIFDPNIEQINRYIINNRKLKEQGR